MISELARLARRRGGCYLPFYRACAGSLYCTVCVDANKIPSECRAICPPLSHSNNHDPCSLSCPCHEDPTKERIADFITVMELRIKDALPDDESD